MITAIVFVNAEVSQIPEVAEAIADLDGISEVYSVTGQIDLIALVRVRTHEDVATVVADRSGPSRRAVDALAASAADRLPDPPPLAVKDSFLVVAL